MENKKQDNKHCIKPWSSISIFENLDLLSGSLLISYGKFSYNIDYSQISNPIYFNALSFPEQYEGLSQIIKSTLSHKTNRKKIY